MRLEYLGLREFVGEEGWKWGLETEKGVTVLEPRFYFIQHEPLILRRRGFMLVVKDYRGYYGIVFLRPKDGVKNGYWEVNPLDGEWIPNPNTRWEVEQWSEEQMLKMNITERIYPYEAGWFISTCDPKKFDYHGNYQSEEHNTPDQPQPESKIPLYVLSEPTNDN